jgi:hypothetical protein
MPIDTHALIWLFPVAFMLEAMCIIWVYACLGTGSWRHAFRLLPAKPAQQPQ